MKIIVTKLVDSQTGEKYPDILDYLLDYKEGDYFYLECVSEGRNQKCLFKVVERLYDDINLNLSYGSLIRCYRIIKQK